MTDKELRRASRKELIEMLYYLRKELDDVRTENERLNARFNLLLGEARIDSSDADGAAKAEEVGEAEVSGSDESEKS